MILPFPVSLWFFCFDKYMAERVSKSLHQTALAALLWLEHRVCVEGDSPTVRRQKCTLAYLFGVAMFLFLCAGLLGWWAHRFELTAAPLVSLVYHLGAALGTVVLAGVFFSTKALVFPRATLMVLCWIHIPMSLIFVGGFQYNSVVGLAVVFHFQVCLILYESFTVAAISVALSCTALLCWAVIECTLGLPVPYNYDRVGLVVFHAVECILVSTGSLLLLWYILFSMRQELLERSVAEARAVAAAEARAAFVARMSHEIRSPVCVCSFFFLGGGLVVCSRAVVVPGCR